MISAFFDWALGITQGLGYAGVVILMTVESSFIPFPSEIVIPPAAYLASRGEMNVWLVFVSGLLGSLLGATLNYYLAYFLGRPLIYKLAGHRFAKFFLIKTSQVERAEKYFLENSRSATFVGRLIPVIRQLVSLPAGFCRMPFGRFIALTALGSGLWVAVLTALGYYIGANQELLVRYYHELTIGLAVLGAAWIGRKIYLYRRAPG